MAAEKGCTTMWEKLAVAMVVSGGVALGSVGVAVAAPASGSGGSPPGAAITKASFTCAQAPKALARIATVEGKITTRLAKLNRAEGWATQNGHPKVAQRIETRISRVDHRLTKAQALAAKIKVKCPA
jgi:hypothetical protein